MPLYYRTRVTIFTTVGLVRNAGDLICTCRQIHFGICPSLLEDRLVFQLPRLYSGQTGWMWPGLMAGGSSLGLGLGFLVVTKCRPRVERFWGLQLVWRLSPIRLVHLLHQKWVLVIWGCIMFPSSWYEWPTGLRIMMTCVVTNKRFWNSLFWLVSWWLDNFPTY